MKIAIVTDILSTNGGGLSSVTKGQLEGFLANGAEARAFGVADDLWYEEQHRWPKANVRSFSPVSLRTPIAFLQMSREIVDWKPDIIHVNGIWSYHIYAAYRASSLLSVPYVVAPHGSLAPTALAFSPTKKRIANLIYHKNCLRGAATMMASTNTENDEMRSYGLSQPVEIVGNGIDTTGLITDGKALHSERRKLLSLGRLHPIKGLDILVRAWAKLENTFPEWDLIIAGPDNDGYKAELQGVVNESGALRVSFPGAVYTNEKFELYHSASAFVLPSRADNFALTVVECLTTGTPVLAAQTTPWSELETVGCGWWASLDDFENALMQLLATPEDQLQKMGQVGHNWATSNYTWPKVCEKLQLLYQKNLTG